MKDAQRLFVPHALAPDAPVALDAAQAHYLGHVLRLKPGATCLVFNGRDGEWTVRVETLDRKGGEATCVARARPQDLVPDLHLLFAPIKGDRVDSIVEKATELGVARLWPVLSERTIVRKVNGERLRARCVEASEQTGRLSVPEVSALADAMAAIEALGPEALTLFADEAGDAPPVRTALAEAPARVALLVGPEGGFTAKERARLREHPRVRPVSLGPRILRADTACFAGLTLVQSAWGDWPR
jgi:16S rRNA (uracil1498-N3)-methyltransferase